MAEKCPYCDWRIQKTEEFVNCPSCGAKHHASCWNYAPKCYVCGNTIKEGCKDSRTENIEKEATARITESTKEYINIAKENINNSLNNEETGIFANVGEKLKSWAKANYVIGIILGVIVVAMTIGADDDLFLVAITAGTMEMTAALAFSFMLYGLGELVSNSKESKKLQQQILDELRSKDHNKE